MRRIHRIATRAHRKLIPPDAPAPTPSTPERGGVAEPNGLTDAPAAGSALIEVRGSGFVPGEDVVFAPVLIRSSARSDGTVRSLVEFDGPVAELLVFGRVSGTIRVITASA